MSNFQNAASELGCKLCLGEEIKPGDLYLCARNRGIQFGTCRKVEIGCVFATDPLVYPYNVWECVKIEETI